MSGFTRSGSLIAAERQDREDMAKAEARSLRERYWAEVRKCEMAGFSEREAPFAASARLTRGPASVAVLRAHLEAEHPHLYEEVD